MHTAVVGHIEWVEFIRVPRNPAVGEIVHATEWWEEPGGGGAAAAVQLRKLAGNCTFFTAIGDDEIGFDAKELLSEKGLDVFAAVRDQPTRRAVTHVDSEGERTITVLGSRLAPEGIDSLPWDKLLDCDAAYFTAGDATAVRFARHARTLVATARTLDSLKESGVELDALVGSARDPGETYVEGDLDPPPRLVVQTSGADGATYRTADGEEGHVPAPELKGPVVDRYGAGDAFAAGLTYALATGMPAPEAVAFASRLGASVLTGRGPYEGQLLSTDLHRRA